MIYIPTILFLLFVWQTRTSYVFNLTADPTESIDISKDPAYTTSITQITELSEIWLDRLVQPDTSGTDTNSTIINASYDECGGICPYINDTYSVTVEQIYSYSDAPHIVFVFVDDWGYNDVGYHSTYMPFVSPNIDALANDGIIIENYFTHESCTPSRGALMTGRYALRLGFEDCDENDDAELPLSETTMAQSMQSAGYRTYLVGKWHLGYSSYARTPLYRGFDKFYGYYSGYIDYYNKTYGGFLDLQDGDTLETDATYLDSDYHSAYIFNEKVQTMIADHAENHPSTPMFLYYALQLVHFPREAPDNYVERCSSSYSDDAAIYCAQNLMLDEAIANLTCALKSHGLYNNTILVVAGDNGGEGIVNGTSYPFRGNKYDKYNGGVRSNAFVHSPLIDATLRGKTYEGKMHVTDWLPTLMGLATDNAWTNTTEIDGYDQWSAIVYAEASPRNEIIHYVYDTEHYTIELDGIKMIEESYKSVVEPSEIFATDLCPENARTLCSINNVVDESIIEFYETEYTILVDTYINLVFILTSLLAVMVMMLYVMHLVCKHQALPNKYGSDYQAIDDDI